MARVHVETKGRRRANSKAAALLRALEQGFLRRLEDRLSHQQSGCPRRVWRQREPLVPQRGACFDDQLKPGSLAHHTLRISRSEPWLFIFDFVVKALTESLGHLVFDTITHQFHDVLRPVQDCRTVGANLEMRFHAGAHFRVDLPIQIIGDLSPDLEAADFYHLHWIRRVPFSFMRLAQADLTTAAPSRILACRSTSFHRCPVPGHPASGSVPGEAWSLHYLL